MTFAILSLVGYFPISTDVLKISAIILLMKLDADLSMLTGQE